MASEIGIRRTTDEQIFRVDEFHPLPVSIENAGPSVFGAQVNADLMWRLSKMGRLYIASDADYNDLVTGQTSAANTTPTFLHQVPVGTVAVPLYLNLSQTGTVAGDTISVIIAVSDVDRYASGGTSERIYNPSKNAPRVPTSKVYSGATASDVSGGNRIFGATIGQDVAPAEGAVQGPFWRPEVPYVLEGPASLLVWTYAGTTGPTWFWSYGFAEFTIDEFYA